MAQEPTRITRSWRDVKFRYTADDGTTYITSDRVYLDSQGEPVIPLTPMFNARIVNDTKTKLWGKPESLRKVEVQYYEPNNAQGFTATRRYLPYRPTTEVLQFIVELREVLEGVFGANKFCTDYRGENRYTRDKPNRTDDNTNI